jgi:beta-glucanase (GH16 family)
MNVASGNLNLTSIKNPYYNPQGDSSYAQSEFLVTGSVQTENKMSFKYGYLEIRAKVPFKEGCWPAFWLRSDNATGKKENAPYEVEIDIFEVFGSRNTLKSNLHQHFAKDTGFEDFQGNPIIKYKDIQTTGDVINEAEYHTFANADKLYDEYHTYGFEWTPDKMVIYVDGVKNCEWKLDAASLKAYGLDSEASGFDTTLNVIFGNNLITKYTQDLADPTCMEDYADTNLPAEFDVDYIRLYQKNDGLSRLYIGN